jgi:hypothetical protein
LKSVFRIEKKAVEPSGLGLVAEKEFLLCFLRGSTAHRRQLEFPIKSKGCRRPFYRANPLL